MVEFLLRNRVSQYHSLDFIIASVMFIFIFISASSIWDSTRAKFVTTDSQNDLQAATRIMVESMMLTPGNPSYWHNLTDTEAIKSLGLVQGNYGTVSLTKLNALSRLSDEDYESIKQISGMQGPGYGFFLNVSIYGPDFSEVSHIYAGTRTACEIRTKIRRVAMTDEGKYAVLDFEGCRA